LLIFTASKRRRWNACRASGALSGPSCRVGVRERAAAWERDLVDTRLECSGWSASRTEFWVKSMSGAKCNRQKLNCKCGRAVRKRTSTDEERREKSKKKRGRRSKGRRVSPDGWITRDVAGGYFLCVPESVMRCVSRYPRWPMKRATKERERRGVGEEEEQTMRQKVKSRIGSGQSREQESESGGGCGGGGARGARGKGAAQAGPWHHPMAPAPCIGGACLACGAAAAGPAAPRESLEALDLTELRGIRAAQHCSEAVQRQRPRLPHWAAGTCTAHGCVACISILRSYSRPVTTTHPRGGWHGMDGLDPWMDGRPGCRNGIAAPGPGG